MARKGGGSRSEGGQAGGAGRPHAGRSHRPGTFQPVHLPPGLPGAPPHERGAHPAPADPSPPGPRSTIVHAQSRHHGFKRLPPPTGTPPFRMDLASLLTPEDYQAIQDGGRMVFHCVGDTGGVKSPEPQQIVAMHMAADFVPPDAGQAPPSAPATPADPFRSPSFFYHLGDVVYYYGEVALYLDQFYEPYLHYPAPIVAIPGNHDGDTLDAQTPSLRGFVENFCAPSPEPTPESGDTLRNAMTQPNVYWTLLTPFLTLIGLYTNVPEGGRLDQSQIAWLHDELAAADPDKFLVVAMHHPILSADTVHSGSTYMRDLLEEACQATGRTPQMVLAAHVHNYQRFTGPLNGQTIPFLVAGGGGYWNLHYVDRQVKDAGLPYTFPDSGAVLESFADDRHGYLKFDVRPDRIVGEYYTVPRPQESWSAPAQLLDRFDITRG